MNSQFKRFFFVWIILIFSCLLEIIPMPEYLHFLRFPWVPLTLIFFTIMSPSMIGLFIAFSVGLIIDILQGGILGESSLALSFITYITYRFRLQIRVFPMWQMMLSIFFLLIINEMMHLWIEGITGKILISQSKLLKLFLGALIWPFYMGLLQNLQTRLKVR